MMQKIKSVSKGAKRFLVVENAKRFCLTNQIYFFRNRKFKIRYLEFRELLEFNKPHQWTQEFISEPF